MSDTRSGPRQPPAAGVFVLVHGAWHGGWCWQRVAAALAARGHRVFTPTLSGLGERSHLPSEQITLGTHVADIANLITWNDLEGVVLCGHSYGGMIITGVAERVPERIAALVYLDAFIPEDGQSMQELTTRPMAPGVATPPPPAASFMVNEKDRAWVDAKTTPQPRGCYTEKLRVGGAWRRVPKKIYARAKTYDAPAFRRYYERCRADPDWSAHEIAGGHDLMVDNPEEVTRLLERAL